MTASRPNVVRFATRGDAPGSTVALGVGAVAAAAVTVWLAYRGDLPHPPGLVAAGVTLALAFAVTRARAAGTTVSIDAGIVSVDDEEGRRRFDLTAAATRVEVVGVAGEPGWRVVLGVGGRHPLALDDSMVDPVAFTDAVRRWRPEL